jgi:hypothetical protein
VDLVRVAAEWSTCLRGVLPILERLPEELKFRWQK